MAEQTTRASHTQSLPVLYVRGTHYQVGVEMGRTFKNNIQVYCSESSALNEALLPYYYTDEGKTVYNEYHEAMRQVYPQYEDELRGISQSSGVEFHKIFLLHISSELLGLLGKQATAGCTDIMLNYIDYQGTQHSVIAHNEDGDRLTERLAYVVHAHIKPDPDLYPHLPTERFVSYTYPGRLPGNCMTVNHHGLMWSINILFPKNIGRRRTGIYTLTRALASAKSLEGAQAIIADDPLGCGYGFSVNLSQKQKNSSEILMMNIEVAPRAHATPQPYHIKRLPTSSDWESGVAFHFNMYERMPEVEQHTDQSSVQRKRTLLDLARLPADFNKVLDILGNQDHPVYPVYRNGTPPDTFATFATGVFDLLKGTFCIYVGNPQDDAEPIASFPI
ncbi:uncharacterized protein LOC110974816 isoform X2 [Acanthaster planci]|uniref:Uncharacterized protein LOC110974816 isoform X2 n=1 Tax=Acanthaster planci TaxID=133434 RepID=A0A8B7XQE0_ACAPL|nr:uncharacterized protein LOC110974816 isoform X2 [Acanthaster planci]